MTTKVGRPRSEETRQLVLSTAYEMFLEKGFKAVTVDKIAEKTSVSKATIYKWWPNKAAVVLDSYFEATATTLPIPDTGSVKEDLYQQVTNLTKFFLSNRGSGITELIAEGQFDPMIGEECRKRYFKPRRQISRTIIERGITKGQLKEEIDIEFYIDCLYAPIFYRLLITKDTIDEAYVHQVVDMTLLGILL